MDHRRDRDPVGATDPRMIIRAACAGDAPAIAAIWNHNIAHTANTFTTVLKTPEGLALEIAQRKAEGKAFIVAEMQGAVVGFATYFQFRGGPGYARTAEHSLMLDTQAQGQGLGRALIAALEAHAQGAGMHSLIAGVSGENPAGAAFHKAAGYAQIAVLPEVGYKFGRWMDLIILQKILSMPADNAAPGR